MNSSKCLNLRQLLNSNLFLNNANNGKFFGKLKMNKYFLCSVQSLQERNFHSTSTFFKRRKTAEERKSFRLIEYSPKSKAEIVDIWQGATLVEVANVLNKDINYAKELFLNQISDPNTPIQDVKLLQKAIRRSGKRMRVIGKPQNNIEEDEVVDVFRRPPPSKAELKPRPPVVTVMGHVDHGKTTLLDALRHSSVVEQEFGGITQHIGAFSVLLESGARVTFLDTPGHAAFSAMRARGANLTDIVVLVVAADDGVMEQTIESVKMARQAKVPILVAINKIDSPKADIERTENMLLELGLQVERLGGDVQAVPISALKRQNLEQLTEALVVQAELLEIGADPTGPVEAIVVESKVDQSRGKLCTIVVQRGTLRKGDILLAGTAMAKVRALKDAEGNGMEKVLPGFPTEIEGWRDMPSPGDLVLQVETEKKARQVIKFREEANRMEKSEEDSKIILQKVEEHQNEYKAKLELKRKMGRFRLKPDGPRKPEIDQSTGTPELNVIIKGDVDGSVEAILDTIDTYDSEDCKLDLIHYGVGSVTQNDVELAEPFKAMIYAFNTKCPQNVKELADAAGIEIKFHNVIYKLVDDLKKEINSRLPKKEVEEILGEANVIQQFEISQGKKKTPVAGCRCTKGNLKRSGLYRLIRNGQTIHTGPLSSMRHLKEEVNTIKTDIECGLQLLDKTVTFEKGDVLICFEKKMVQQETDWDPGF